MLQSLVTLDYKNILSQSIALNSGITDSEFAKLTKEYTTIISKVNNDRNDGIFPYRDLPYNDINLTRIKKATNSIRKDCKNLVIIGSASLIQGIKVLYEILKPLNQNENTPTIFIIDSKKPDEFRDCLTRISSELDKTYFNIISKSGQNQQTLDILASLTNLLKESLGESAYQKQIIITTDFKLGKLRQIATEDNLTTLLISSGIDGANAILSDVGLFAADISGFNIDNLLAGSRLMDPKVSKEIFTQNPAAILSAIQLYSSRNNLKFNINLPFTSDLNDIVKWIDSLSKEASIPSDKNYTFTNTSTDKTVTPELTISSDTINEHTLGQFIYLFQVSTSMTSVALLNN